MKYADINNLLTTRSEAESEMAAAALTIASCDARLRALGVTDLPGDAPTYPVTVTGKCGKCDGTGTDERPMTPIELAKRGVTSGTIEGPCAACKGTGSAVAPKPALVFPGEPTEEMIKAGTIRGQWSRITVSEILRAALAAAPRVEAEIPDIPEITSEDAVCALRKFGGHGDDVQFCHEQIMAMCGALLAVRKRLNARMGAKS